jgi:hypothetical protein
LIDFDGWRRWKTNDIKDETKRGFQLGLDAKAKTLASRLRIERTSKPRSPDPVEGPTAPIQRPTPTYVTPDIKSPLGPEDDGKRIGPVSPTALKAELDEVQSEAPPPSATLSSIEEDAETSAAPDPVPPKRSKANRVGFDLSVDPKAQPEGDAADDGPQPDSAPSSGDSALFSGEGKPLPELPGMASS